MRKYDTSTIDQLQKVTTIIENKGVKNYRKTKPW